MHMRRITLDHAARASRLRILVLAIGFVLALPAVSAQAVGDWDPPDVEGRYDFRWIGATYTRSGRVKLTVSFYPGFRIRSLPYRGIIPGVTVDVDEFFTGWFTRNRKGGVKFGYADLGSSCCRYYPVTVLDGRTLRVRFEPANEGPPGFPMRGISVWGGRHGPRDRTSLIRLPAA
jgi:hypothetical protein